MDPNRIYLRNAAFEKIGEIDNYNLVDVTLKFNDVSNWIVNLPIKSWAASNAQLGVTGLIFEREGDVILSGPIRRIKRVVSAKEDSLEISGSDDLLWILGKLALPVYNGPPFTAQAYDVRVGLGSTIMRQYVDLNAGPSAVVARRVTGLTIGADPLVGASVTGSARFVPLPELLRSIALAAGDIGFRIIQSGVGIQFQVYQPADLSDSAVFELERGTLLDFEYEIEMPTANYIYVGGQGEGTARTIYEKSNAASITDYGVRLEVFLDRRDTNDSSQLEEAADNQLLIQGEKTSLRYTPVNTDTLRFGTDYNLGDRVAVKISDERFVTTEEGYERVEFIPITTVVDIVREVRMIWGRDGETINPSVGTPEMRPGPLEQIFNDIRGARYRVSNLERQ